MKKLFILFLIIGISLSIGFHVKGVTETIEYNIIFTDNYRWDVEDGSYYSDPDYIATNRLKIVNDEITLNNLYFHHILFWDRNGNFLGYLNSSSGYETTTYLGDTDETVDIPLNAIWFSLTAKKQLTTYSELNSMTLKELFVDNQIGYNPTMEPTHTQWLGYNSTATFENGYRKFSLGTYYVNRFVIYATSGAYAFEPITSHKYYHRLSLMCNIEVDSWNYIPRFETNSSIQYPNNITANTWWQHSYIITDNDLYVWNYIDINVYTVINIISTDYVYLDNVYWYDLTDLGIDTLTVQQLDDYYNLYVYYSQWGEGFSLLQFYSIEATYDREEIVTDDRSLPERINDGLDDIGLNSTLRFIIGIVFMVAVAIILGIFNAPTIIILFIEMLFFTLFALMSWFEIWTVFVVLILISLGILIKVKGGN